MFETRRLRQRPENQVLSQVCFDGDEGTAQLLVNQQHRFFFDHQHDHIPGLLLLEGGHQLTERLLPEGAWFASELQADFTKYCLFDSPVELHATRRPLKAGWVSDVILRQRDETRATLHWVFSPLPETLLVQPGSTVNKAIEPSQVNKHRPENVMIGKPDVLDSGECQCHALQPHCANLLADSQGQTHPLYLLEAFMQLQRSLNHRDSYRLRDILLGVGMQVYSPLGAGSGFHMQANRYDEKDQGRHFSRGADLWAAGECFARCEMHTGRIRRGRKTMTSGKEDV